jgi:hypothetical protein
MLGFRIVERGHDAIVELFEEGSTEKVRAVHPATRHEVVLYLRVLGLVARLDELTAESASLRSSNEYLQARIIEKAQEASALLALSKQIAVERDEAIAGNNELEKECDALTKRLEAIQAETSSLYARIETLEDNNNE